MLAAIELPRAGPLTWDVREYLRLSKDQGGTSIQRQGRRNRQAREERGWTAGPSYDADGDRSASPYRKREREDFDRLLKDLISGQFDAKILQAYETSRITRESDQAGGIIKACRDAKVKIFITTSNRLYDMENASDRRDLRDAASRDEFSSDETSMRTGDTAAMEAERGRPHAVPPFGFRPVYDERRGKLVNWFADHAPARVGALSQMPCEECGAPVGSKAHLMCMLFERLESGSALKRLEREFAESGYVNKKGQPFPSQQLRLMALRPAYAGIRTHKGKEYPGTWDGIVKSERFYVVRGILQNPARRTTRSGRALYKFTGTFGCERCREGVGVRYPKGREAIYKCPFSHASMQKADADEILTERLLDYLSRPDIYEQLTARSGTDRELTDVRTALAKARLDKQEMDDETPKTLAEVRVLARAVSAKEEEISALENREREMTLPPALAKLLGAKGSVRKSWFKAPVEACREIVRHVMVPELLGRPLLVSAGMGQRWTPSEERIKWEVV